MSVYTDNSAKKSRFQRMIPSEQFFRYFLVGIWNTVFSYGLFAVLTSALDKVVPQSYMVASVISSLISITVSFLGYKWFVFKTKGNYIREWCRCLAVYSGSIALGFALLPVLVFLIRHYSGYQRQAPYIAGALLPIVTVGVGFFGHKHISFRQPRSQGEG
jgi:putative flippase GtrA